MNKFIFDVDGTLTPSRGIIDQNFKEFFLDFCNSNDVYLVTGSDYPKTLEQLGQDVCMVVKTVYNCSGNDVWQRGIRIHSNDWTLPAEAKIWLLDELQNSKFVLRTGNHIEERPATVNFSIVGRNATLAERKMYVNWDEKTQEREMLSIRFNNQFPDLEARVGGETGIDVYQLGCDKSQILKDFKKTDNIYFFGDRTTVGGNDYPLADALVKTRMGVSYQVKNWKDTYERLQYLIEAKVAA
jgi:phosphomannomutase